MLAFEKWVGAGNDFVFVHEKDLPLNTLRSDLAQQVCHRNLGIGADGLVILRPSPGKSDFFVWDFYNSDGSKAEMCGNAARCTAGFINNNWNLPESSFETLAGTVSGRVLADGAEVSWTLSSNKMAEVSIDLENFKTFKGFYINTGVPHFVLFNQLAEVTLEDCSEIQSHPRFGEQQTNVTLLDTDDDGVHHTKTFERGVRNFTLACGTGVIASAFVLQNQKKENGYELLAPGGKLSVKLNDAKVTLAGPAQFVFSGRYLLKEV